MIKQEYLDDAGGVPTYNIVFSKPDLVHKMKNCGKGDRYYSKTFKAHGKDFAVSINPNSGDGKIEVYLNNKTGYNLFADVQFLMSNVTNSFSHLIKASNGLGFPSFVSHDWVNKHQEDLKLVVKITKVVDDFQDYLCDKMDKVTDLATKLEKIDTKFVNLESFVKAQFETMASKMAAVSKVEKPKCPYCFEEMNSTTKIAQCISGHMICWSCKEKDKRDCGLCGQPVNGRAFGMESYLRGLFG